MTTASSLAFKVATMNSFRVNPDLYLIENSKEQKDMLAGKVSFPLPWVTIATWGLDTRGLNAAKFLRKVLKECPLFAIKLFEAALLDVTIDTIFDCCHLGDEDGITVAKRMLNHYKIEDFGIDEWERTWSQCLTVLLYKPMSESLKEVAKILVSYGANINERCFTEHILATLMRSPKKFTASKFALMLEIGLHLDQTVTISNLCSPVTLVDLFTGGLHIDECIKILQLIKNH